MEWSYHYSGPTEKDPTEKIAEELEKIRKAIEKGQNISKSQRRRLTDLETKI